MHDDIDTHVDQQTGGQLPKIYMNKKIVLIVDIFTV